MALGLVLSCLSTTRDIFLNLFFVIKNVRVHVCETVVEGKKVFGLGCEEVLLPTKITLPKTKLLGEANSHRNLVVRGRALRSHERDRVKDTRIRQEMRF